MKSKLNTILLYIFVACASVLITLMLVYVLLTKSQDSEPAAADNAPLNTADTSMSADPAAEPAQDSSSEEEISSVVYKQITPIKTNSSSTNESESSSSGSELFDTIESGKSDPVETRLFWLYENTPVYIQPEDSRLPVTDYPDVYAQGLYSGRDYPFDERFKQIDYLDRKALVPADSLMIISNAKIMPASMISQVTSNLIGYSGCGPACLHMMERYTGILPKVAGITSYEQLLDYAQSYGYGDQGSLYLPQGGMTCESLMRFARDVYGIELANFYGYESHLPSDLIKALIDDGRQAIVLIHQSEGEIVDHSDIAHFVLFTGYTESNGEIEFIYANSYTESDITFGYPLKSVPANIVDASVSNPFENQNNAILYIK